MKPTRILAAALGAAALLAAAAAPAFTTLPTQWRIAPPAGPFATVGTLPSGIAIIPGGNAIAVVDAGFANKDVRVLDASTLRERKVVGLSGAFGAPLADPAGDGVWVNVAGGFEEQIAHVDTATGLVDDDVTLPLPFYPVALARSPRDGMLAVAGDLGDRVAFVDPRAQRVAFLVDVGHHPAALAFADGGDTLFVADRGESVVDRIDVRSRRRVARIAVGLHPDALAVDHGTLYVAVADDDAVDAVDVATGRVVQRARIPFARDGVIGTSPNALALAHGRLYVSCGAANAIAVFATEHGRLRPLGAIPAGWYPTAVAVDAARGVLYEADGKGESGHPNPRYSPLSGHLTGYVATQLVGGIRRIAIPSDAQLAAGLREVRGLEQDDPLPPSTVVRADGPIKHVFYVIKENRTYDEVLGDLSEADGDPSLVLFGAAITPNEHALAQRFGVFDRFFEDSHVSADGHNWSTAAFANDYLEKMWPQNYSDHRPYYDFQDGAEASVPADGYLWDDAARHRVTMRNYGEWVSAGPSAPTPVSVGSDILRARTDRNYPTFDLKVHDVDRFAEWKREFEAYERTRTLPQLEIVYFPQDHTSGTRAGAWTPQADVADNDEAVGKLVDAISHSRDWASSAIFIIEDDAQNGADHVDEQRAPFYLISPYAAGGVQHAAYTQASVLRTIEVLLGMSPMSPYDAGAAPLDAAFRATADLQPYDALPETVDINARNGPNAYKAAVAARLDFGDADAVDDATLNDLVWHAVKGARATPPPYGAFR